MQLYSEPCSLNSDMKTFLYLFVMASCLIDISFAQTFAEPLVGYQKDLNNKPSFAHVNAGIQLAFKKNNHYEFLLQLQKSLPLSQAGIDSAFTPNTALPLYIGANKTIKPSIFSLAVGHRFKITDSKKTTGLFILLYTGLSFQKMKVEYKYDKENYSILNPDKTLSKSGVYISTGIEYMRSLKNGRLFLQLCISTEPLTRITAYPASFHFMAPLAMNLGYSLPIKKKNHEKKKV